MRILKYKQIFSIIAIAVISLTASVFAAIACANVINNNASFNALPSTQFPPSSDIDQTLPDGDGGSGNTWAGSGTIGSPFKIYTKSDLNLLAKGVNDGNFYSGTHFILMNDLDFGTDDGDGGIEKGNFAGIGVNAKYTLSNQHPAFMGNFDGNGKTIKNFKILIDETIANQHAEALKEYNYFHQAAIGFFGVLSGNATVKNLKLQDFYLDAYPTYLNWGTSARRKLFIGGIAGMIDCSSNLEKTITISNCEVEGLELGCYDYTDCGASEYKAVAPAYVGGIVGGDWYGHSDGVYYTSIGSSKNTKLSISKCSVVGAPYVEDLFWSFSGWGNSQPNYRAHAGFIAGTLASYANIEYCAGSFKCSAYDDFVDEFKSDIGHEVTVNGNKRIIGSSVIYNEALGTYKYKVRAGGTVSNKLSITRDDLGWGTSIITYIGKTVKEGKATYYAANGYRNNLPTLGTFMDWILVKAKADTKDYEAEIYLPSDYTLPSGSTFKKNNPITILEQELEVEIEGCRHTSSHKNVPSAIEIEGWNGASFNSKDNFYYYIMRWSVLEREITIQPTTDTNQYTVYYGTNERLLEVRSTQTVKIYCGTEISISVQKYLNNIAIKSITYRFVDSGGRRCVIKFTTEGTTGNLGYYIESITGGTAITGSSSLTITDHWHNNYSFAVTTKEKTYIPNFP